MRRFEQKTKEQNPREGEVKRFFEMTRGDEIELRERIKESDGLVRVFVHPEYELYSNYPDEDLGFNEDDLQKAEKAFRRVLASESEDLPPLIIFEGGSDKDDFEEKEERLSEISKNDVYVIRTEFASPNPLPPGKDEDYKHMHLFSSFDSREEKDQMWEWVVDEFRDMGIKSMIMGGLELYVDDESGRYSGCLGIAINKFKDSFNIEVSALTDPDRRKDIRESK